MNLLNCVRNIEHLNFCLLGNFLRFCMKKHIQKDRKLRKFFDREELSYIVLKSIVKNENLSLTIK